MTPGRSILGTLLGMGGVLAAGLRCVACLLAFAVAACDGSAPTGPGSEGYDAFVEPDLLGERLDTGIVSVAGIPGTERVVYTAGAGSCAWGRLAEFRVRDLSSGAVSVLGRDCVRLGVLSLAVAGDGQAVFYSALEESTGTCVMRRRPLAGGPPEELWSFCLVDPLITSRVGTRLAFGEFPGAIYVADSPMAQPRLLVDSAAWPRAFSPDATELLYLGEGPTAWRVPVIGGGPTAVGLPPWLPRNGFISGAAWTPLGIQLVAYWGGDARYGVWNASTGSVLGFWAEFPTWAPSGDLVAGFILNCNDDACTLLRPELYLASWTSDRGRVVARVTCPPGSPHPMNFGSIAFASDGRRLAYVVCGDLYRMQTPRP